MAQHQEVNFAYGISAFERRRGNFPSLPVVNMLAEEVPTEPGVALQSRPGLETTGVTLGDGPIRSLFKADGILNKSLFAVSGNKLYQDGVELGTIDGTGPVSWGGYEDRVFVNCGKSIWVYDGSTLSFIPFPDNADVSSITVGASRLIAVRKNTGTFYWSNALEDSIDPLNFATAENSPDTLKDLLFIGDRLILFGAETIEFWPVTGEQELPFIPLIGAVIPVGALGTGAVTKFNGTFAWITDSNEVCVGSPDVIVSEPQLQVDINNSSSVLVWTFYVDDNEYLAIRLDNKTWVYGARTQVWSTFESYGESNWLPQCFAAGLFGTSRDGLLVRWSPSYRDFDGVLERRFRAWAAITSNVIWLSNVVLRTNPGETPYVQGEYSEPIVELRTSRDGGNHWQPWKQRQLGKQGQYLRKVFWSSLGQFSFPGALVEFRASDPVPFRISGVSLNEPFGGR